MCCRESSFRLVSNWPAREIEAVWKKWAVISESPDDAMVRRFTFGRSTRADKEIVADHSSSRFSMSEMTVLEVTISGCNSAGCSMFTARFHTELVGGRMMRSSGVR
jgi:hypothetical protein